MKKIVCHPAAIVQSSNIGSGTQISAFAKILCGAAIGSNSTIAEHVVIANDVKIENNVYVGCGVRIFEGTQIESDVVIGANTTFADNTLDSRASKGAVIGKYTRIGRGARIGANSTIERGLTVGQQAEIRPGSVVSHNVPPFSIVSGNPAQIIGYVDTQCLTSEADIPIYGRTTTSLRVRGAGIVEMQKVIDLRGMTTFAEIGKKLPFVVKRFFVVSQVPGREIRGEHAHKTLHEFLVCLQGSISIMLDDGAVRDEISLDSPTRGLHVPPQLWRVVYRYTPDAVMLSLCSEVYEPDDYIRDYAEFLSFVRSH